MRDRIRNADLRAIRQGVTDGIGVLQMSAKLQISVSSLEVYYPKKVAPRKKPVKKNKAD